MNVSNSKDQVLLNLMSASSLRYRVLTNNLVNQNTPGYTRQTVQFEDLLAKELESSSPDLRSVRPVIVDDEVTPATPDGNNVNAELELNGLQQNRLQYELYSTIIAGRAELMRAAIQESR